MTVINHSKKKLALALFATISFSYADQNIEIIGGSSAGNPKLAIVNFTNDDGSINDEMTNDFKITGEFNVTNYANADAVESSNQYVIIGKVSNTDSGNTQINYQLINNLTKKPLLDQTASFNTKYLRKAVHAIDNNIYKTLTNTPGIFTTKIALAVKEANTYSIVITDYDGYNPRTLISTKHPLSSLTWNKTGQLLSYVSYESGKPVVYIQNIAEGSRYIASRFDGSNSSPSFSANSQKLAVTLSKDYGSHIYLINNKPYSSYSQAIPLINYGTIDTEADINQNGKVIFTSDHDGSPQIFMSDLNGAEPVRVTSGFGDYNTTARYSNDGTKITYINHNRGLLQTYVLDLITQSAYPIDPNGSHDIAPSFAPNDKLVLYSGDNSVYLSNITGTTKTRLNNLSYDQIIDQRWAKNY